MRKFAHPLAPVQKAAMWESGVSVIDHVGIDISRQQGQTYKRLPSVLTRAYPACLKHNSFVALGFRVYGHLSLPFAQSPLS
jgi:hypothetical protein